MMADQTTILGARETWKNQAPTSAKQGHSRDCSVGRPKMFAASILWPRLLMQMQFDLQRVLSDPWVMLSRPPCLHGFATEPPDPLDKGRG